MRRTNGNTQTERIAFVDVTSYHANADAMSCARCTKLEERIAALEAENQRLQGALGKTRNEATVARTKEPQAHVDAPDTALSRVEMQRYSRQMLVPDFRITRQMLLRRARVLVIGAGGLGCPVALYLGGMGVGCLGLVDNDSVERSNLHRQIGHDESTIGIFKVESLATRVRLINPDVVVETHVTRFSSLNAAALVDQYDVVVDASDNPATRYLVNDVCAAVRKPLISGSALGLEGQVTVFTYEPDTACYRCLYPTPPRQPQSCEENGVLGVVPGIVGCMQALETVKVITSMGSPSTGSQLLFDAYDSQFRRIKIVNQRRVDCSSCGEMETATLLQPTCGGSIGEVPVLGATNRIGLQDFSNLRSQGRNYVLLDTRPTHQFEMVHFPEAINVPFDHLRRAQAKNQLKELVAQAITPSGRAQSPTTPILVICRRGIDSVTTAAWLLACGMDNVFNVEGGYTQYADAIDKSFPMY